MRDSILSKPLALVVAAAAAAIAPQLAHGDNPRQVPSSDEGASTSQPEDQPETSEAATRATRGKKCWGPRHQVCGRIKNHDKQQWLRITNDWPHKDNQKTWHFVKPGHSAGGPGAEVEDVDGFFVGNGCKMTLAGIRTIGPGWYRIRDPQYIQVTDIRC